MRNLWQRGGIAGVLSVAVLCGASTSVGGAVAEQCFGSNATIVGTEGNDQLVGTAGNDVIAGLGGDDVFISLGGDDALCGGAGNDSFLPGPGNDRVDGGGGGRGVGFLELVFFEDATNGVHVDLQAGTATGEGTDTLLNITGISGTRFDDTLLGDANVNHIFPGNGNDMVDGREGDDVVGFDSGVVASLVSGTATGEGTDKLVSIEGLSGSKFADVLTGDRGDNYIAGGPGNDVLDGGAGNDRVFGDQQNDRLLGGLGDDRVSGDDGTDRVLGGVGADSVTGGGGDDTIDGGGGEDLVSYLRGSAAIQANLLVGRVTGEGLDKISGTENLEGSELSDQILGNAKTNFLSGNAGADRISAGAGADFLDGGSGGGSLSDGAGRDYCLRRGAARGCEISGLPGPVPRLDDEPPASRISTSTSPAGARQGLVMRLPDQVPLSRRMGAVRERILQVFGPWESSPPTARGPSSLFLPLEWLRDSAAPAGSFRYVGQPSCYAGKRPYRTTIAPPDQLQPAIVDGQREQVFWRGMLFRQAGRGGKLVRTESTPWATAIVQGPAVPTGFPKWTNASQTAFVSSFSFTVPAGTYSWAAKIKWTRTGREREDFVEPHIVHTTKIQPDKSCTFGS